FGLAGAFVGIPLVAALWDKRFGARVSPDSRAYRIARRAIKFAFTVNLMRFTGPMMWTLMTNVGRRKAIGFLYVALTLLIVFAAADRLWNSDRLSFNSYDYFAASRSHEVSYRYYE